MARLLVVLLNKDNAEGLRRALASLEEQSLPICRGFDVLVMDGGSRDGSREVAEDFARRAPCVSFVVQSVAGGTGPARAEACSYAWRRGYEAVVWGDSENIYGRSYVERLARLVLEQGCDVAGGRPIVRGGFWAHAFFWYHAIHLVFPGLWRRHIPGNNRCERVGLCIGVGYPPSSRAEDYGFTLKLLKRGLRPRHCVDDGALVKVSVPSSFGGVIRWQLSRARGAAEAARYVGAHPVDAYAWSALLLLVILGLALLPVAPWALALLAPWLITGLYLAALAHRYIEDYNPLYAAAPLVGLLIHALFSTYTAILYAAGASRTQPSRGSASPQRSA